MNNTPPNDRLIRPIGDYRQLRSYQKAVSSMR